MVTEMKQQIMVRMQSLFEIEYNKKLVKQAKKTGSVFALRKIAPDCSCCRFIEHIEGQLDVFVCCYRGGVFGM